VLDELRIKYPRLYDECRWISCGSGWRPIIEAASGYLDTLERITGTRVEVCEIRQKYGTLRIWVTAQSSPVGIAAEEIARNAETASETICEVCGASGSLRECNGYLMVRCNGCFDAR
jgi:hypothetical protein